MATTETKIEETLTPEVGSAPEVESAGSAAGAYPSDEEILGIGDSATAASAASEALDAHAALDAEKQDTTPTAENAEKTESSRNTAGTESAAARAIPKEFEQIFAAAGTGPKLREIYQREAEYRKLFPTVSEARELRRAFATSEDVREAIEARRELARVDELFESGDPAAHVELMAGLAQRDPAAFRSLAATFGERLAEIDPHAHRVIAGEFARATLEAARLPEQLELLARAAEKGDAGAVKFLAGELAGRMEALRKGGVNAEPRAGKKKEASFAPLRMTNSALGRSPGPARREAVGGEGGASPAPTGVVGVPESAAGKFVEGVNADVEKSVEQAVGGRVAELLPDAPEATRRKIAAEIYRELDAALKKDSALLQQVSANFTAASRSCGTGQFGEQQRAAMAALVMSRAKAVLPGVAKRVVSEWTSAVMSASQARRAKQGAAAALADVGVGGAPRPVSTHAARVDYGKMSDEEILNAE